MKILDNQGNNNIVSVLRANLLKGTVLSIVSEEISVFLFDALDLHLKNVSTIQILLPPIDYIDTNKLVSEQSERYYRNTLRLNHIAQKLGEWLLKHGEIKSSKATIPQNLYLLQHKGKTISIHGSSSFTAKGIGLVRSDSYTINTYNDTPNETKPLSEWFDNIWNNSSITSECKTEFLDIIKGLYADYAPQITYYLTLRGIFEKSLGELDEDSIIKSKTGIKDKEIWKKLYKFQRDGVLGAVDKIERYNGCIIADSVGLGKTFEALAIIKYYELRNDRVLVLCSKKMRENWTIYTINDKRNIFSTDRFNYDVLCYTDLTRTKGHSGEINLESVNWGNYDLVVIDESHNFRNNPPRRNGLTRYSRLMKDIIRSGVKTKVLMLSATPVNSRMNDLKNQVSFITSGLDDMLFDSGINSIEQTLRLAQTKFNSWLRLSEENRTTQSLLNTLNYDYFKLLDLLTIARSRKHILKYYDITELGPFPERAIPINIKSDIDTKDQFPTLIEINRDIRKLNLAAYAPLKYVLPGKIEDYQRKYDMTLSQGSVFRQIDREESLIYLMRVNLFKRMESSINSFALTLERLLNEVKALIEKIDNHDGHSIEELDIDTIEIESEEFAPFLIGNKIKVLIKDIDKIKWKQELKEDESRLTKLLREARMVDAGRDAKLSELKKLISKKIKKPINPGNKKVLIFTAFADTANYLYTNIAEWALTKHQVYTALVTGRNDDNKTTMPNVKKDLLTILTNFSPLSKERSKISPELKDDIDILIGTDCISEGQNLQDCDYVINYDIHWNPVRIIQRFGRIDRIGSQNKVIQLINFWPNMELDEYINLESRVAGRMVLLDISATGEENIIEYKDAGKMNDLEYRRKQLEQLQHSVIDLEDLGGTISITDMTFNEFRMDLIEYLKHNEAQLAKLHMGLRTITKLDNLTSSELEPGVIFFLKSDKVIHQTTSMFAMEPYYLIYVTDKGEVKYGIKDIKQVLDAIKKLTLGRINPVPEAIEHFNKITNKGADMSHYQMLLGKAIASITGSTDEQGVESLFHRGGTVINKDSFRGIDDFEVITYLIIV